MIGKEGLRGVGPCGPRKCCASPPRLPAVRAHRDRLAFLHEGTTHKRPSSLQVQCCHWRAIRRRDLDPSKTTENPEWYRRRAANEKSLLPQGTFKNSVRRKKLPSRVCLPVDGCFARRLPVLLAGGAGAHTGVQLDSPPAILNRGAHASDRARARCRLLWNRLTSSAWLQQRGEVPERRPRASGFRFGIFSASDWGWALPGSRTAPWRT
jgi:hypothetical protein